MATGYLADGSEDILLNLGWAAPAGQMYSTVNDLMKVLDKKVHWLYAIIQLRYKVTLKNAHLTWLSCGLDTFRAW